MQYQDFLNLSSLPRLPIERTRKMRWAECVVHMTVIESTHKIWSENLKGNLNLRNPRILELLIKINVRISWDSAGSG